MKGNKKRRIDQVLVDKGLFPSRERAQRSLMAGVVFYKGKRIDKPGTLIDPLEEIYVKGDPCPYVSRGGLKLEAALKEFNVPVSETVVLDAGASTGGFTQCLLEKGAKKVYAVDVGYGQLAWKLRQDPRVVVLERTNLRHLTVDKLGEQVDLATLDLSFISLGKVLPAVKELLSDNGMVVALVKPQFEAGPDLVGKGGIVRDPMVHRNVLSSIIKRVMELGFVCLGVTYSPICGADGNIEFLVYLSKGEQAKGEDFLTKINAVVEEAHFVHSNKDDVKN